MINHDLIMNKNQQDNSSASLLKADYLEQFLIKEKSIK